MGRGEGRRLRRVGFCASRKGCDVSCARRLTCGPGCTSRSRVANLRAAACAWAARARTLPIRRATGEGSQAVDGITRACVARCLRLEHRPCPLGTVGGPHGHHSPVVFAQGQGTRLAPYHQGISRRLTRCRPIVMPAAHSARADVRPASAGPAKRSHRPQTVGRRSAQQQSSRHASRSRTWPGSRPGSPDVDHGRQAGAR